LPLRSLAVIMLVTLGFAGIALTISLVFGMPFTFPVSGDIPGLHVNYWIPPLAAAISYLLLQFFGAQLSSEKRHWRDVVRHAADDYLLLGLFILVICLHFNMKMWVPAVNSRLYDQEYFAVDQALQPVLDAVFFIRNTISKLLPGADLWYMAAFIAMFVVSFISHALGRRRYHYHNMVGLLLLEMMGPLSYFIAPAVGPFVFEHGLNPLATKSELQMYDVYEQVRQGGASWIAQNGAHFFAQPLAAMPSLHVGASLVIAYYAVRGRLLVAPLAVLTCAWVVVESVAARWHYLIDLPPGILLAALAILGSNYICRKVEVRAPSREGIGRTQDVNA